MSSGYTPIPATPAPTTAAVATGGAAPSTSSRALPARPPVADPCDCLFSGWERLQAVLAPYLPSRSKTVGYSAGILFSLGWWVFLDGLTLSVTHAGGGCPGSSPLPTDPCAIPPVRFEDWVPGLIGTLSLIIVNLVDKEALSGDDSYGFSSSSDTAYRARAVAFIGVTMGLGAIGGALAILSLKYILTAKTGMALYFGVAVAVQSILIFVSSMVFWFGRNGEASESGSLRI